MKDNKAIVTVLGQDQVGIISTLTNILAESDVNILDISQTILQDYFTMIMVVDVSKCKVGFGELKQSLLEAGEKIGLQVNAQKSEVFDFMHRI
ncbi:ACT domain-containing protein [Serpentinicella sp. ANB-PHB4]|uniref:ACT domain-containing protein n=1 Tax=Serpentinicella sp. ANB-PHB4 TaxID=3074076 RepID=UPI002864449C|nr:ACT domain-containing protein [Serpentinicella sp. ANB-PHB4]MDR5657954.1 ACT domain-containing protein [Serpentinicella sp. ANB-PHB4]